MKLVGLAGPANSGKDTVAEILRDEFGWAVFSFSDELYSEVAQAFGVSESYLRQRRTKEQPSAYLTPRRCADRDARAVLSREAEGMDIHCSPRWVLQRWGTDYRRAQNPHYWLACAAETLWKLLDEGYPGAANTSVRFPNEREWIEWHGGTIVHVKRPGCEPESDYESEKPLPVRPGDVVVSNDGTIDQLREVLRNAQILERR